MAHDYTIDLDELKFQGIPRAFALESRVAGLGPDAYNAQNRARCLLGMVVDVYHSQLVDLIHLLQKQPFCRHEVKQRLTELRQEYKSHIIVHRSYITDDAIWADVCSEYEDLLHDEVAHVRIAIKNHLDALRADYADLHVALLMCDIFGCASINMGRVFQVLIPDAPQIAPVAGMHRLYRLHHVVAKHIGVYTSVIQDPHVQAFLGKLGARMLNPDVINQAHIAGAGTEVV
jgi:hypothetical protein